MSHVAPRNHAPRLPPAMAVLRCLAVFGSLVAFAQAAAWARAEVVVRVLLAERTVAEVQIEGPHRGFVDGQPTFETPMPLRWPVAADDGHLVVDGRTVGRELRLVPADGLFAFDGRAYRGAAVLIARGDRVLVVDAVPLEDYLRGVVPAEMQASWPMEALKAQAVAARTYALSASTGDPDYDICATDECQVYRGASVEHPRTDRAIAETRGLVLTHGGRFARTYYHSDSGGVVASSAEVWGSAAPYLVARHDVETATPHRRWRHALDPAAIAATARAAGRDVGSVHAVRVVEYSASGRVLAVEVSGAGGAAILRGPDLADALRAWGLKSTRFRMAGPMMAEGDGWGHGVGMSQYGARAMADAGHAYWQILAFYYPGTSLQRLP